MTDVACELVDVTKRHGDRTVLDRVSLTVAPQEMVAIVGPSGSGKTTILNLLGLLESPDAGEVRLFDLPTPAIGSARAMALLRTRIGYLFQNGALIDDATIGANLDVALRYQRITRRDREQSKVEALQQVGLDSLALRQPVYGLSGGEQQRVAMARLLLKPCDLILADEPTGSLDPVNREAVLQSLQDLNRQGKTIVIVTHDPVVAAACVREIDLAVLHGR